MKKIFEKVTAMIMIIAMVLTIIPVNITTVEAAAKPKLAKKSGSIVIGQTKTIKMKNKPKGAKVTYKSTNKKVATVTKKGKVKGIKAGTANINVVLKKGKKKTKLAYNISVKKPKLSFDQLFCSVKNTKQFVVKNKPKNASYIWSSENNNVATIDRNGKMTAISKGVTIIVCKIKTKKKTYRSSCKVAVQEFDERLEYTVTFDSNGGSAVAFQTVKKNEFAKQPSNPNRNGYIFDGWYTEAIGGQKFNFNTAITGNITLYAHWTASATDYYKNNSKLIKIIKVEESDDVLTETKSKSILKSKGFGDNPISYDYSITGNRIDDTEVTDGSTDAHPMYQTLYLSQNGEVWAIYVINGSVFANPVSFNLESNLEAQLLFSETETLTSYDDKTNQFYVTIPQASEVILKTVEKIDAASLDKLTIEKICNLSGAAVPATTDENGYTSARFFFLDNSYMPDPISDITEYSNGESVIIVSLGDSYSSGESIIPFYGQEKKVPERVKDHNWLAHRSTKSWPSLLKIPGVEGTMSNYRVEFGDTSTANVQWYFGAVSGAETKHFKGERQNKEYCKNIGSSSNPWYLFGTEELPKQLDIFKSIDGDVDYVTLSIGGNDIGFADVVTTCAVNCVYLHFGATAKLEDQFNDTWAGFSTTKANIRQAYEDVSAAAGSQAAIIIAGYPQLLDPSGKGFVINKKEANLVNTNVSRFNDEIESIVNECRCSGMNIYFVDVESEFSDHLAYSNSPWINKIIFGKKEQDLSDIGIGSAYSVHPNEQGAQAYARCVNAKIKEIEDSKEETHQNRYKIYDFNMTWNEAKAYCESLGGHLATITTPEEQNTIVELLQSGTKEYYWIGGTDVGQEGIWRWITNEPWDYENWHSTQPDNDNGGEDYLGIVWSNESWGNFGDWNDYKNDGEGSGSSGFICEWE